MIMFSVKRNEKQHILVTNMSYEFMQQNWEPPLIYYRKKQLLIYFCWAYFEKSLLIVCTYMG